MTRIAILSPSNLLGQEVRSLLDERRDLWDEIDLLASDEEEVGTVTEAGGAAKLVTAADAGALEGIDLLFACGALADDLPVVERRPGGTTAILLSPGASPEHGRPVIAGLSPPSAAGDGPSGGEVLVSPHPAAIALAHLLAPLADPGAELAPERAVATVLHPVSLFGSRGLDDLLAQTRDVLSMTGERRDSVFARQLAFNLYPVPDPVPAEEGEPERPAGAPGGSGVAELVRAAAGLEMPLAVHAVQGAVFHGVACSLFVQFAQDPGAEAVHEALAAGAHVGFGGPGEVPGAIDAAARDDVLVGSVSADAGTPASYWIWAVMDNLTRGGALNAVEVAEAVLVGGRSRGS